MTLAEIMSAYKKKKKESPSVTSKYFMIFGLHLRISDLKSC